TEWWYFTGHLQAQDGRRFGYQLTFFRTALAPPGEMPLRSSAWATDQLYMAHFTVTDVESGRFYPFERFSRGALGLAGAQAEPFRVWLEDWSLESVDLSGADADGIWPLRLRASSVPSLSSPTGENGSEDDGPPITLDLQLHPEKPPVFQGEDGYSRKGPDPGNASYYYSYTRLAGAGSLRLGQERFTVEATSWLDREWSTSALGPDLEGWDWFSLQLDGPENGGSELMFFRLRRRDGEPDPYDDVALVAPDGSHYRLPPEAMELEVLERWQSPDGTATYPVAWRLRLAAPSGDATDISSSSSGLGLELPVELQINALIPNQELRLAVRYWEGAVEVEGTAADGSPVTGRGYVELTGYASEAAGLPR
ncbi:MAG: carotenoid 1,2-hydratase, partial [Acidobacteriota bacterium]|nr:carotenoid 1,2-hydratase [Acidobacteriota bacterium]